MANKFLYGGISGVEMDVDSFDFGEDVVVRRTYAHLMSPCLMAFSPPGPARYHPAPWKPAKGGFSFDISIELRAPHASPLGKGFGAQETVWWIAALMRLAAFPYLSVAVLSDHPFDAIVNMKDEPTLQPFETTRRIFRPADAERKLDVDTLNWVKEKWLPSGELLKNKNFYAALKSFDFATLHGRTSGSLLALWGALETLFSPARSELRFRVASLLSSYLEPSGDKRRDLYKRILGLYDQRSAAAHTAQEPEIGSLVETYVLARNALVRMVDDCRIPSQSDLEALLFGSKSE
jgi:hypothetical protein